jgi:hypothetical protein
MFLDLSFKLRKFFNMGLGFSKGSFTSVGLVLAFKHVLAYSWYWVFPLIPGWYWYSYYAYTYIPDQPCF